MSPKETIHYDCNDCPAFCCSVYERVEVKARDLRRLAKYFGISEEEAARRHTKVFGENERILRRKKDALLGTTCKFLDTKTRGCTIYEARPAICRDYPARPRCGYFDLYRFEQEQQGDPEIIPVVQLHFRKHRPAMEAAPEPVQRRIRKKAKPANDVAETPSPHLRRRGEGVGVGAKRERASKSPSKSSQKPK